MKTDWARYQQHVCDFFVSLGFETKVEAQINGIRGKHKIDVFVTFDSFGIKHIWVIECKHWKSNVPKEKVLALQSIVQDIGADKGFLLSEKGFQSGAISCARNSNIVLSSLEELKNDAEIELRELKLREYQDKIEKAIVVLSSLGKFDWSKTEGGGSISYSPPPEMYKFCGRLSTLESSVKLAKQGMNIFIIGFDDQFNPIHASDFNHFIQNIEEALKAANLYYEKYRNFNV